jgi:cysteinyl-tRNA synthetase
MKNVRQIRLTNSMTHRREELQTREAGKLTFYSCGPTVYDLIHIGNLRAALTADLFFRIFLRAGYEVNFVRNYTDIDDKILKRAQEQGVSPLEVSEKYIKECEKDYAVAGLLEPTHKTKVTEHLPEIQSLIQQILDRGHAYLAPDGEVLFSIESFPTYGCLSHRTLEGQEAQTRVRSRDHKKHEFDFTLWKPAKAGEISWPSPWGAGRPGWHIECSAMAQKWLGSCIDVHHGGEDLIFPHHENEIAQSEAASGEAPYVRYWLHHAFVNFSKEKMSKSLGNVISARNFLTQFGGEFARFFLLSVHYRTRLEFSQESLEQAHAQLSRIYEAKLQAERLLGMRAALPDMVAENAWGEFVAGVERTRARFEEQLFFDFNTPGAFAEVFALIREFNRVTALPRATSTPTAILAAQSFIKFLEHDVWECLGMGRVGAARMLETLSTIKRDHLSKSEAGRIEASEVDRLIRERQAAKLRKEFQLADSIREELKAKGVLLKDSPHGTTWEYL